MNITIFSTTTCPYCKMLKDYLKANNLSFQEKLVDQSEQARKEMIADSGGFLGVPFTVIGKSDGTKETVIGFDKKLLDQLLELTSQSKT